MYGVETVMVKEIGGNAVRNGGGCALENRVQPELIAVQAPPKTDYNRETYLRSALLAQRGRHRCWDCGCDLDIANLDVMIRDITDGTTCVNVRYRYVCIQCAEEERQKGCTVLIRKGND
jgi:hypothetical protein